MIRGIYTAASGMLAQQHKLDALSNNLANVNTHGYKRDESIFKAFPELLIRRMNDDGVVQFPLRGKHVGSIDTSPVVGKLGTGVEQNEVFTIFEQGGVQKTEAPFDIALEGSGFFVVETPYGERYTRNGSFQIDPSGTLVTKEGYPVLGEQGHIQIKQNNFVIDEDGKIFVNAIYQDDPYRLVSQNENRWEETVLLDRVMTVDVDEPRYLRKQGSSLWSATEDSGPAEIIQDNRPKVLQGFLEVSNVNPVTQMVEMIEVNRSYEASQRVIQSQDTSSEQLINVVLRV